MRAVKGNLATPLNEREDKTRAIEDQPGYPVKKDTSELGRMGKGTWPLPSPSCYDADPMSTRSESGQTNLIAIAVLVGVVIAGVWVWKRLSLDTQGYVIDQAIPMAFVGLVIAAGRLMVVPGLNRRKAQWRQPLKLM